MVKMTNNKLKEQLQNILENLNLLETNLNEKDIVADIIHNTFRQIHNIKSNLFLVDLKKSLQLTYYMESYFEILRIGEKIVSSDSLDLFRKCIEWIREDISELDAGESQYGELLSELKNLKKSTEGNKSGNEKLTLSSDEKALLKDARNSGLNIYIVEHRISIGISLDKFRNHDLIRLVNSIGLLVIQTPQFSNINTSSEEDTFLLKLIFVTDKSLSELTDPLFKGTRPFEEDLFLSSRDYKILIVEDNPIAQLLQKSIMSSFGVCDAVSDGEKALELFNLSLSEESPYQIILLDLVMPGINGSDVLKKIRSLEEQKKIKGLNRSKIIIITTTKDSSVLMDLFRAETDAYIIKPLTKDKIKRELKNLKLI